MPLSKLCGLCDVPHATIGSHALVRRGQDACASLVNREGGGGGTAAGGRGGGRHVRVSAGMDGRLAIVDDDAVRKVRCHDEIVLDDECRLFGVQDKAAPARTRRDTRTQGDRFR